MQRFSAHSASAPARASTHTHNTATEQRVQQSPIRDFENTYRSKENYAAKKKAFVKINTALRADKQTEAIEYIQKHPDLVNIGENSLDFDSVGRFTTPFLLAATHGRQDFLKTLLNEQKTFKPNFLSQSHCGQQVLSHALVQSYENARAKKRTTLTKADYVKNQTDTAALLINAARAALPKKDYQQFMFGGGVWKRTPLYNALTESHNPHAAELLLQESVKDGLMPALRAQSVLQLNRPISFYFSNKNHFDLFLKDATADEKNAYLQKHDDLGNNALHFATDPAVVNLLTTTNPELLTAKNRDKYTPAEALALTLNQHAQFKIRTSTDLNALVRDLQNTDSLPEKALAAMLEHEANKTSLAQLKRNQIVRDRQISLSQTIQAVQNKKDIPSERINFLKENYANFSLGTKEFLARFVSKKQFPLSPHDQQELANRVTNAQKENFMHAIGIENEFLIPAVTRAGVEAAVALLNTPTQEAKYALQNMPKKLSTHVSQLQHAWPQLPPAVKGYLKEHHEDFFQKQQVTALENAEYNALNENNIKAISKHFSNIGVDPEPSLLCSNVGESRIEINSPIIRDAATLSNWYMLNDLAKDLGATKNHTAGIHVHVGVKGKIFPEHIDAVGKSTPNDTQLAFLKTFLHTFTAARPAFDAVTQAGLRPDYTKKKQHKNDSTQFAHYFNKNNNDYNTLYSGYLNDVNALSGLGAELDQFIKKIGREKYVTVALPKDAKGTLEIRELKSRQANKIGFNQKEMLNIVDFVKEMIDISKKSLTDNPPLKNKHYTVVLPPAVVAKSQKAGEKFYNTLQNNVIGQ